jgi:glycosyltransferase involved in cell wall biosynthesis
MTINKPLISVIIPAFNVSRWIESSINSIQKQSISDLEIIVIDDGSCDDTFSKVNTLANEDLRIRAYKNEINSGIVATLNRALNIANGEFIARMDADDLAAPDRLEKQLQFLNDNPNYALVGSQMITIDEAGRQYGVSPSPVFYEEAKSVLVYSSPIPHIWLCRKSLYTKLGGYRSLAPAEDYDFILRLESYGMKYGNHSEALMMIRLRNGNTASLASLKQRKAQNYVISLYKERLLTGVVDSYSSEAFERSTRFMAVTEFFHNLSSEYLSRSVRALGVSSRIFYILVAILLSPYNAQYVWRRLLYRVYLFVNKIGRG